MPHEINKNGVILARLMRQVLLQEPREMMEITHTAKRRRALPPALAVISCGCFLPDLTRFTTPQCGETRQFVQATHHTAARLFLSLATVIESLANISNHQILIRDAKIFVTDPSLSHWNHADSFAPLCRFDFMHLTPLCVHGHRHVFHFKFADCSHADLGQHGFGEVIHACRSGETNDLIALRIDMINEMVGKIHAGPQFLSARQRVEIHPLMTIGNKLQGIGNAADEILPAYGGYGVPGLSGKFC